MSTTDDLRSLTGAATRKLKPGQKNYRAFVGNPNLYDLTAAMQFNVLTSIGLREHHRLLELATVVTWPRRGYPIDPDRLAALDLSANERDELLAHVLPVAADDVAATTIRSQLGRGEPAPDLDPAVQRYAVEHELYRP